MIETPRITTDRLTLRLPEERDFADIAAFMTSKQTRFVGDIEPDPWRQWQALLGNLGHWLLRGYGFFAVERIADGAFLGRVGIVNHIMWPEAELGWNLNPGFEGHGYATEAAVAARDWMFETHGQSGLISQIHPDNTPSIKLAERIGAIFEREDTLFDAPCLVYRHPKQEVA
ncbi:GNAT family N-acetyltransferase [Marivita hallyeonensis]|uniref:Protein N-acetyltransferase, RimJ/RimL family n=1 Tax=Marivita hallyeonensis TaxID=996342 RepID=A0A1M5XER6_9RHOB|nr:GNAT family N-acetyltransferase [Marivita hallyeonensis]SHH97994.1 Protein N-acetyltransferase, RimJ/RimL family [Marivita hallyeonensis]